MIQIRRFLIFLACLALCAAVWLIAEKIVYKYAGEKHTAIVTKIWHESSAEFRFLKSKNPLLNKTNHAEIALLDDFAAPIETNGWDSLNQATTTEFKSGDLKQQLAEKFKRNRAQLNQKLQDIRDALTTPSIPLNAPRYSIHNIADKDANPLYEGKKIDVFIFNQHAKIHTQVEHFWSEREQIFLLLGVVLLMLSQGIKYIKPHKRG